MSDVGSRVVSTVELPVGAVRLRAFGPENAHATVVFTHGALHNGELWVQVAGLLAERGIRCYIPEWPTGADTTPAPANVEISPRSIACSLLALLDQLDLREVTLVGGVDGGAINQIAVDIDHCRVASLVFTNSPAFELFPPALLDVLLRALASPVRLLVAMTGLRSGAIRHSPLGFGLLTRRPERAMTRRWIDPILTNRSIRRDTVQFINNVDPSELLEVSGRMRSFTEPVEVVWGTADPFFKLSLGERLTNAFPDAELITAPGARTFTALDAPALVAVTSLRSPQPTLSAARMSRGAALVIVAAGSASATRGDVTPARLSRLPNDHRSEDLA